jgi:hypothetical protein
MCCGSKRKSLEVTKTAVAKRPDAPRPVQAQPPQGPATAGRGNTAVTYAK